MPGAGQDILKIFLVLGEYRADSFIVKQFGKADDAVEWRAQLVRHIGEKFALEAIGLAE